MPEHASRGATLVAIGGIDDARKGYVATRAVEAPRAAGVHAVRLHGRRVPAAAGRSPRRGTPRLDEMFARVVDPLVRDRRVSVPFDLAEEASFGYRTETLDLRDVHFALDAPRDVAAVVIDHDPRLTPATARPEPRA